ncbi:putative ankyrin repeat protein [Trichoderma lentiforme]|uniref:Ankyrin repeat protein n=1 Tax=Trichoderma lentiforme TaxID=1567552 RepID=A0A9P4X9N2_9HYPO|nr:putative ankyrin repeat protein [Trichoderma lentiforme]
MPNRNDYTIGWICALSTEQIAAEEFLDEEHQAPDDIPPTDSNHYTLGSIGKHNIVITVLPRDEYGIASAANVATNLLRSFPNIRIGLLVGIGGGAPSEKHDIRLGDVVVSAASANDGGVFQYDFGKTIQGESFQNTGFLNMPPTVLRTAVSSLRTQHKRKGHRLKEDIDSVLKKNKRLRREFGRPPAHSDRLFRPDVIHNPGECASACAQDESSLIRRRERIEDEEDDPAIHYGLIASANQLMKDASIRDKLSAEKDVLCFEMEAAGLVNHFPCLVIRGICDYSDSHKNKEWQGYAAMTAAAYAKDLIRQLHPSKIEAEQRLSEVLDKVLDTTMGIKTNVQDIRSQLQSEEDCKILEWLSESDYSRHHNDNIYRRQEGTGQWLLNSKEYQDWLSTSKQKLFCPGIPGAGKTILTAIVIDNLHTRSLDDSTVGIAYHYCNFKRQDEQTAARLMASLLKQLCSYQRSLPDVVKAVHKKHTVNQTRPSLEDISITLQSVAGIYSRVFIAIDALDECQPKERSLFLSKFSDLQVKAEINIFATSRPILEIEKLFNGCQSIDIVASPDDIYKYVDGHISQLSDFVQHNPELQEQIKTEISASVQGMFLLAQLYLSSLEDKISPKEIRQALERIKLQGQKDQKFEILHDAYDDTVERIKSQKNGFRRLAEKTLSWINHAKRQLTVIELQHALAVDFEMDNGNIPREFDDESKPGIDLIVSVCCGLLTTDQDTADEESRVIRLVHYTAQEYLSQIREKWFPGAEMKMADVCAVYLSFDVFESGAFKCENRSYYRQREEEIKMIDKRLHSNPFYAYASINWGHHARESNTSSQIILNFLADNNKVQAAAQVMLEGDFDRFMYLIPNNEDTTGLSLTSIFGAVKLTQDLLDKPTTRFEDDLDMAIRGAVLQGYTSLVELLLENGADPDTTIGAGSPLITVATADGYVDVVRTLLRYGADPNKRSRSSDNWTALLEAVRNDDLTITELLLENGANYTLQSYSLGTTVTDEAIRQDNKRMARLLLDKITHPMEKATQFKRMMLSSAVTRQKIEFAQMVFEKDPGLDLKGDYGTELLFRAIEDDRRNRHIIELLLEKGASPNVKGSDGTEQPLSEEEVKKRECLVRELDLRLNSA